MARLSLALLTLAICLGDPGLARAQVRTEYGYPPPRFEPPPPSGIGAVVVGYAGLGIGAINLLTIPVCYADFYPAGAERGCMIGSLVIAGVAFSVGIPSLAAGLRRRERHKAWRARQLARGGMSPWLASRSEAAGLQYALRF